MPEPVPDGVYLGHMPEYDEYCILILRAGRLVSVDTDGYTAEGRYTDNGEDFLAAVQLSRVDGQCVRDEFCRCGPAASVGKVEAPGVLFTLSKPFRRLFTGVKLTTRRIAD
ncbi:hypothetical protein [Candidatus Poriferisocius sp.]|uniref:hypothetical protein n=1 Tax=Candidatus Poriferisocius sp. TaxID=3101276 RepID=UPI003B02E88C